MQQQQQQPPPPSHGGAPMSYAPAYGQQMVRWSQSQLTWVELLPHTLHCLASLHPQPPGAYPPGMYGAPQQPPQEEKPLIDL